MDLDQDIALSDGDQLARAHAKAVRRGLLFEY
jgi:hypothetical protein